MKKHFRHETPYGIVSETYETDKNLICDFTFYNNGDYYSFKLSQVAEIIEAVDDDIAEHYDQGKEPCNLALELMRLQTQIMREYCH